MFAWLAILLGRLFLFFAGAAVWYKVIALGLMLIAFPAAVNHIIHSLMSNYLTILAENTSSISAFGFAFSDCAGFLASKLRIPEAFSLLISFVGVKLSLKLIPFLRF